ncbi:MAG: EscU/YscU/HrcU family type III secretion system export apparatus switch protein, partial [Pseudomonadota bacterium]
CPVPVILRKGRRKDAAEMIEIGKRLDLPAVVNDVIAQHLMKAVSEGETIDTYSFPAVAQAIYLAETQWDSMKG